MRTESVKHTAMIKSNNLRVIWRILYNPAYGGKSLYGVGVFPFWLYIKYFGKPVYKMARKYGLNKYFSLMAANTLGSLAHVNFFINSKPIAIVYFIVSLVLFSGIFLTVHKAYKYFNN